jgi:hypothetical protein
VKFSNVMGRTKKNTQPVSVSSEDESNSNTDKLDEILNRLAGLDSITKKLSNMEMMLTAMQAENKALKETIKNQDGTILELKEKLNNLEQHGRSFSVRVTNLPLEGIDERDPPAVIKRVYDTVFLPILQGAAAQHAISSVPTCYEMIEMAHPLPGRSDKPKPIIVRFFNRNLKAVLFKHRKEFAVKEEQPGQRPKYRFPFHDDLTKDTFNKLKLLQSDPRVQSCWSTGGSLRYRLVDCNIVRRVSSVYKSNDEILK